MAFRPSLHTSGHQRNLQEMPLHLHVFLYKKSVWPGLVKGSAPHSVCEQNYSCCPWDLESFWVYFCVLQVIRGNLVTKSPSSKEDVSATMFPTVDLMSFYKNRAEQKFACELKEGIRAYKNIQKQGVCNFRRNLRCICKATSYTPHDADCSMPVEAFIVKVTVPRTLLMCFFSECRMIGIYESLRTLCEHERQAWEQRGK